MRIEQLRARLRAAMIRWTAAAGVVAIALASMAGGWTISEYRVGLRADEAETAHAAYVELLAEVSRYYDEFSAVARDQSSVPR